MSTLPNNIECVADPLTEGYTCGTCVGEEISFNCILYRCVASFECQDTKNVVTRFERVGPDPEVADEYGVPVRGRGHGL